MLRTLTTPRLARLAVIVPFAALLATACEHNDAAGPPGSGQLLSITVLPDPTNLPVSTTRQFTAVGRDATGAVMAITPVWSTLAGGTINSSSGLYTGGAVAGTFVNSVRATSGGIFGDATVTLTAAPPGPPIVPLGAAAPFGILAGTEVTCITGGIINANVGVWPGTAISGFPPCTLTGTRHPPSLPNAQTPQNDLTTAYNALAGLACGTTITANLGGTTLAPGVYCSASSVGVTGVLTLDAGGNPDADFVIQAGSSLTVAGSVNLINGADAANVWWQVGSSATIGTGSLFKGNIIALTSITLVESATLLGRALARNGAVTLGTDNVITLP